MAEISSWLQRDVKLRTGVEHFSPRIIPENGEVPSDKQNGVDRVLQMNIEVEDEVSSFKKEDHDQIPPEDMPKEDEIQSGEQEGGCRDTLYEMREDEHITSEVRKNIERILPKYQNLSQRGLCVR